MRPFWSFLAGSLGSFLGLCFLFQLFTAGFFRLDDGLARQVMFLLLSSSVFFGLVVAVTVETRRNEETDGFGAEVSEGLGHLAAALLLLRHRSFLPLWISAFLAVAGLLALRGALAGALPLLAGQALWFLSRFRLLSFLDTKAVPIPLENPLRAVVFTADVLFALSAWPLLGALSGHGQLESRLAALAASLLLGFGLALAWLRARRSSLDAAYAAQGFVASVWASLVILSLNYSLDFRPPERLGGVTKLDCVDRRAKILAGQADGTGDPGLFRACELFDPAGTTHRLEDIAVTNEYPGGLGLRWRRAYVQKAE